jgi:hypothetical protein
MKGLVGLCTVLYKSFPTSIQQDKQALQQPGTLGPRGTLAVQFRLAQKQALEATAARCLARARQVLAG